MHIVFDSNTLIEEFNQDSMAWKTFSRLATAQGHTLVIPRIVYLESLRHYISTLDRHVADYLKFMESIQYAYMGLGELNDVPADLARQFAGSYSHRLIEEDKGFPVTIIENHRTDMEVALRRVVPAQRPINAKSGSKKPETNIRDTLIWLSILQYIEGKTENFVFISADSDFGDQDERIALRSRNGTDAVDLSR